MDTDRPDLGLYQVELEGAFDALQEHGFFTDVLVSWHLEGDVNAGLVRATPEQVERLRPLLHVRRIEPPGPGLYVDRSGHWYAIQDGAIVETGWEGMVPREALRAALGDVTAPTADAAAYAEPTPSVPIQR
jgi:hypothetical protein